MDNYTLTLMSYVSLDGKIRFSPHFTDAFMTCPKVPEEVRHQLQTELKNILNSDKCAVLTTAETILSHGVDTFVDLLKGVNNTDIYILDYEMEIMAEAYKKLAYACIGFTIVANKWNRVLEDCSDVKKISYITLDSDEAFFGVEAGDDELEVEDSDSTIDYVALFDAIYQVSKKDIVVFSQSEFTNSDILHTAERKVELVLHTVPIIICDDNVPCAFSGEQLAENDGYIAPLVTNYKGMSVAMNSPSPLITLRLEVPAE